MFGTGISREGDLLDIASEMDIVQKSGLVSYQGERLGQGRENVKEHLKNNPDLFAELEKLVRASVIQRKRRNAVTTELDNYHTFLLKSR
jgi:recombination protein RecA